MFSVLLPNELFNIELYTEICCVDFKFEKLNHIYILSYLLLP